MNSSKMRQTFSIASNYPSIKRVGLFGSYARGEENANSDIDILIDYDDTVEDYIYNMGHFMEDIEQHISAKIDYVTLQGLMNSRDSNLKEHVLNEIQWLYNANTQEATP